MPCQKSRSWFGLSCPWGDLVAGTRGLRLAPEISGNRPEENKFGVFAKLSKPDSILRDRDRVEIYRPLIADPKEVRKQRAAEGKVMKKALVKAKARKANG